MTRLQHFWTQNEDTVLRKLNAQGLSASMIGERMGLPRMAVAGRMWRLGIKSLVGRKEGTRIKRSYNLHANGSSVLRPHERQPNINGFCFGPRLKRDGKRDLAILDSDPPEHERVAFADLGPDHCRFPLGDKFCGRQKTPPRGSGSYCHAHAKRCYAGTPVITRKEKHHGRESCEA